MSTMKSAMMQAFGIKEGSKADKKADIGKKENKVEKKETKVGKKKAC